MGTLNTDRNIHNRPDYELVRSTVRRVLINNMVVDIPVPVDEIAESYGCSIKYQEFKDEFAQIAGFINLSSREIVVNQYDSQVRQRFTIAHELGHLLLHAEELENNPGRSIMYRMPIGEMYTDTYEKEANTFASNLLIPESWLEIYDREPISDIAKAFNVSIDVVGYRLSYRKQYR